ncbi:MAG: TrmB family transcriptional regulator [Lachnospiraceae bacterium]|nr:TrmB family transcriptional regulator [Lachnospiraceae bacterium]MBQ9122044.1 TrmB family transcriptional regulator [Lachnospiraceae bacterium]
MEETAIIERLMHFGLSRQDAIVYLCLLKNGELSGYEVAKLTSISRSNVYSTLSGLVEHGAAYLIEGSTSKYLAVPMEDFCEDHIRKLELEKKYLAEHGPKPSTVVEGYVTVEGHRHVMNKIYHMLEGAMYRVYLSATKAFVESLSQEIEKLIKRDIKVVLITDEAPEKLKQQELILYIAQECKANQIRLIVDSTHVLTGEIGPKEQGNCLYCGQENFVNVFKEAMRNEILLIELKGQNS